MAKTTRSARRTIRDLLVLLACASAFVLTGCCPGGACPNQILGGCPSGNCPAASLAPLAGALAGALPGCPNS